MALKGDCQSCRTKARFITNSTSPTERLGHWEQDKVNVCVQQHSLEFQSNRGVWFICDVQNQNKCVYYLPIATGLESKYL